MGGGGWTRAQLFWVRILISRGFEAVNAVFVEKIWFWWKNLYENGGESDVLKHVA
jgi:hypothetical protein